jgi:hypothetical protein
MLLVSQAGAIAPILAGIPTQQKETLLEQIPVADAQLAYVNTTDLRDAIALGCETMGRVFNREDSNIPFFAAVVVPEAWMRFHPSHSESHVPGRHLNALLTAEEVLGIIIPEKVITLHADAAIYSYSGGVQLPLNREQIGGPLVRFLPHNLREGFHALYALARYRSSDQAQQLAADSIEAILRYWTYEDGWDANALGREYRVQVIEWNGPFITGIARALGPLVKYHRATGYTPALELATELKDALLEDYFIADGAFDRDAFGTHTHSTTCVMSSLAQYADAYDDEVVLARVRAFFDNGLKEISDEIGWSIENCGPDANPDRGECNNSGDILETALILGRLDDPAYFQTAERITRSHLLPAQLRDISFIPPSSESGDGTHDVARRLRGAFGFPAPYGHEPLGASDISFNLDIVGGTVASLCEAVREGVTHADGVTSINLLFDHADEYCTVQSPYTGSGLTITRSTPGTLRIALPDWVETAPIAAAGGTLEGRIATFADVAAGSPLYLPLPIPERDIALTHRDRAIHTRLRGDAVIAMEDGGARFTFFDAVEVKAG